MGIRTSALRGWAAIALLLGSAAMAAAQSERERKDVLADLPKLIEGLEVREGHTVADVGAGWGWLTVGLARHVGPRGRVYGTELGEQNLAELRGEIEKELKAAPDREKFAEITVLEGAPTATNLPDECCDAIFTRLVYHHFADPAAMNASLLKALKPGGRFAVLEFIPGRGRAEAKDPKDRAASQSHGVGPGSVERELKEAGFEIVSVSPIAGVSFTVIARKPAK